MPFPPPDCENRLAKCNNKSDVYDWKTVMSMIDDWKTGNRSRYIYANDWKTGSNYGQICDENTKPDSEEQNRTDDWPVAVRRTTSDQVTSTEVRSPTIRKEFLCEVAELLCKNVYANKPFYASLSKLVESWKWTVFKSNNIVISQEYHQLVQNNELEQAHCLLCFYNADYFNSYYRGKIPGDIVLKILKENNKPNWGDILHGSAEYYRAFFDDPAAEVPPVSRSEEKHVFFQKFNILLVAKGGMPLLTTDKEMLIDAVYEWMAGEFGLIDSNSRRKNRKSFVQKVLPLSLVLLPGSFFAILWQQKIKKNEVVIWTGGRESVQELISIPVPFVLCRLQGDREIKGGPFQITFNGEFLVESGVAAFRVTDGLAEHFFYKEHPITEKQLRENRLDRSDYKQLDLILPREQLGNSLMELYEKNHPP